ncbi:MAG TPA: hypothetical protein VFL51_06745 [Pseudolabrys sp.]|nr:hypothetical protein [Pseudolabrys sp.]
MARATIIGMAAAAALGVLTMTVPAQAITVNAGLNAAAPATIQDVGWRHRHWHRWHRHRWHRWHRWHGWHHRHRRCWRDWRGFRHCVWRW